MENNNSSNKNIPIQIPTVLPLLPVRNIVIFPYSQVPLSIGRERSLRAVESSLNTSERLIFVVTQKKSEIEIPSREDLYNVGTICEIIQFYKTSDGTMRIMVEGIIRGKIVSFSYNEEKGYNEVTLEIPFVEVEPKKEIEAFHREVISLFEQYVKLNKKLPLEIIYNLNNIADVTKTADIVASSLLIKTEEKQELLEIIDPAERLQKLVEVLAREIEILDIERKIQARVKAQIEKTQKEYYLTEQMKAIQKELKQKDEFGKEIDELRAKVKQAKMPKEVEEVAQREISRLEKMMPFSPEATVVRTYIEWLVDLPWSVKTKDNYDIARARKILDEDHYGLEKVKERVLEYLAVLKLTKKLKGPILCFVGPPGVGKSSIARSIARAMGRNFVRVSLGGVRDEAEIRGHRRTYIGALPGRIIQQMRKAKSKNPVFLLDEIDKIGVDWRGDPAAALLEVLDPEQNHAFVDHYLDVEFDLSDVMFIATANTLYSIPPSLVDRLEIIRFPGYTMEEKMEIATRHLIPKQMKAHGLKRNTFTINKEGLKKIINDYTREAGVRNFEREISNLCRKIAIEIVEKKKKGGFTITARNLKHYLGIPQFYREKVAENEVGIATGLAWTEVGGELLSIEVTWMKGREKLILTGKLGEVMQESAQAAVSYVRSICGKLNIKEDVFKNKDIHIHIPEGAIPKDGPSAGIAIATALVSLVTNRPVKKDIAMTGEITLRGRVLPIGGLKEKVIAAYREGIKTVLYPEGNKKDLEEIPKNIQKKINLIPVKSMEEVINIAITPPEKTPSLDAISQKYETHLPPPSIV